MSPCDPRALLRPMLLALPVVFAGTLFAEEKEPPPPPPIRALLVTGGCSHDYQVRQEILTRGIRERVARPIEWVVRMQGVGESDVRIPLFESAEWAKDYDIVVHDHCFPRVRDTAYVDRVLAPHRAGLPAVLLHGTMMSFRTGDERWFDFTGLTTRSHERERAVRVEALAPGDPILKGFGTWEISSEELYRVEKVKSGAVALTRSLDPVGQSHTTSWTHRYGPAQARVFGTTLGNATATVADAKYLDLIARGFLWSLGELSETSFRVVPEAESLKGLVLEIPASPLPKPGRNAVREGKVSAFSWGATAAPEAVALTNDGDPATVWSAATPGPGAWEVSWRDPREVGAVVVYWNGAAPKEARLEGIRDGLTWQLLAKFGPPLEPETPVLVPVSPSPYRGLRISVDAMPPGGRIGLREVAAFDSEASVPAAILVGQPLAPKGQLLQTAGTSEFLSRIPIAPGWKVSREGLFPESGEIAQIVPTASGGVFLSVFPEPGASGSVYRVSPEGESGFAIQTYLAKIESGARIAWDGEWLYTLSGPRLERVRRALGNGPADERFRLGSIYSLPEEGAPRDLILTHLRFGNDGWLYSLVSAESPGTVLDRVGESVHLPGRAVVRFRRDGRDLSVCLPSGSAGTDYRWNAPGEMVWADKADVLDGILSVEGRFAVERDGDFLWVAASDPNGSHVVLFSSADAKPQATPHWDETGSADLVDWVAIADRPSVRIEGMLELLRRKRESSPDIEKRFSEGVPPDSAEALVTAISGLETDRSLPLLIRLAESEDPAVSVPAFLALGDHSGAVGLPIFSELGKTTVPRVSAAILEALRRSRSPLPGSVDVALSLTAHPDPHLAGTAATFLGDRRDLNAAFAALDDDGRRGEWPGALTMLQSVRTTQVVDELIARTRATRDPEFRNLVLRALCAMYFRDAESVETYEASSRIQLTLKHALHDHRVSRSQLLGAMEEFGLPEPDPATLVGIAREDLSLESAAVDALLVQDTAPETDDRVWLEGLYADPARDEELRLRSLVVLARYCTPETYRRWFKEVARWSAISSLGRPRELLLKQWFSRTDHGLHLAWLLEQTKGSNEPVRRLAWQTLLTHADAAAAGEGDRLAIWKAVEVAADGGVASAGPLVSAIAAIPLPAAGRVISELSDQIDPSIQGELLKHARARGLDPRSGKALIDVVELDPKTLDDPRVASPNNLLSGSRLFRTLECGECHNIHGEGGAIAPDLALAIPDLSPAEQLEALLDPGKKVAPAFQISLFGTVAGRSLTGWVESRGEVTFLRDLAGNSLSLTGEKLSDERVVSGSPSGCPGVTDLDTLELSQLLVYLRSLAL